MLKNSGCKESEGKKEELLKRCDRLVNLELLSGALGEERGSERWLTANPAPAPYLSPQLPSFAGCEVRFLSFRQGSTPH